MEANTKIIDRIRKLQEIANRGVSNLKDVSKEMAEVYANEAKVAKAMADSLLSKYNLSSFDLRTEQEQVEFEILNQVGKSIIPNPYIRSNSRDKRCFWFEELAKIVAENNGCKIGIEYSGETAIYGYALDRDVSILIFNQLAKVADSIYNLERLIAKKLVGTSSFNIKTKKTVEHLREWIGDDSFEESFHKGFREEIIKAYKTENENVPEIDQAVIRMRDSHRSYSYYEFDQISINEYAVEIGRIAGARISEKQKVGELDSSKKEALVLKKKFITMVGAGGVLLAIDCSVSMEWGSSDKLSQAKRGAMEFAKKAREQNFAVGIIEFSDSARILIEPTLDLNGNFSSAIEELKTIGGTNMTAAIEQAMHNFVHRKNKRILVLVTDGQPNNEVETLERARIAKLMGIEIRTIGTDDADLEFLKKLASNPNLALKADSNEFEFAIGNSAKQLTSGGISL